MTDGPFDPEALVEAMAPLLNVALTPQSRAQTIAHLRIAAEQAALLFGGATDDADEPAPVYRP
jgi:hypothetical protein